MAHPANSEKEWIELYNASSSNIDITQWSITELTATSGNINSHNVPSVIIPSNSSCFLEFTNNILNDAGDTVSLINSNGTQIDSYSYTSTSPGKTFSRVPDGGAWQTDLTDPTKSNINCNNLLSPSPTPTPTPSPTATPTDTPQATSSFIISNTPSQINSDQSFSVNINLSMPNSQNTDYYLKGAFKQSNGTRYLGLTKIGNSWIEYGDDDLKQYKVTTDSSGKWTGNLDVKPDINDKDYKGTGDYIFKVVRLTSGGSAIWSNETTIKINDISGSTSSSNPTLQPIPKITPSPPSTKLTSPTSKPTPSIKTSYQIASVAGATTSATPEGIVEVKSQKQTNPFVWVGLIFIFAGAGAIGYIYLRSKTRLSSRA